MSEVAERVKVLVAGELGIEPEKIRDEAKFVEDLGADSLDIVEFVMLFEDQYDIEIPDEDVKKITTVSEAMEYIERKVASK